MLASESLLSVDVLGMFRSYVLGLTTLPFLAWAIWSP